MILITTFFATLTFLFHSLLAAAGVVLAVAFFVICIFMLLGTLIGNCLQTS